jgi:hypothetical protein
MFEKITALVLEEFDRQIASQNLTYHNREHVFGVQRRARQIFQIVCPDDDHAQALLDLCALAHDMIQIFVPQTLPRLRESGVSEHATLKQLLDYAGNALTAEEIKIVEQAILVTIFAYDPIEQAIYQPDLAKPELSWIARTIALADIGALAIEGIEAYNREGRLLLLEENPDILHREPSEAMRQQLLKRAGFQVSFARSRFARLSQELNGFPPETIPTLMQTVFQYATPETLEKLAATTPTSPETSISELLDFFQFDQGSSV